MIRGTPKADGIAVSAVAAETRGVWQIEATVRLVDSETGSTHSSCKYAGPWSEDATRKLKELVEQLEKDAAKHLLRNPSVKEAEKVGLDFGEEPSPGLGEYIGQESI